MDCPFCAEAIQDAAIVCRFCGARKVDGEWREPPRQQAAPQKPARHPARATMHGAALCFLLSAAYSCYTISDKVPLFGDMRGGAAAIAYNLLNVVAYVAVGIGVWGAWRWGYKAVMAVTLFFTVDGLRLVLDTAALKAQAAQELHGALGSLTSSGLLALSPNMMIQGEQSTTLILVAGWWGWAAYCYFRRDYFRQHDPKPLEPGKA